MDPQEVAAYVVSLCQDLGAPSLRVEAESRCDLDAACDGRDCPGAEACPVVPEDAELPES